MPEQDIKSKVQELIAQHPAAERSGSRLLDGTGPTPVDRVFRELPPLLNAGALLVFALLVAPPATAQLITMRPLAGVCVSIALGLLIVWLALGFAYFTIYPVGFYVTTFAFAAYVITRVATR